MSEVKGNTAVPKGGDIDRVQSLSLRSDGTPDQTPGFEMIGDRETAITVSREQFAQQAVSAVDQAERHIGTEAESVEVEQDPEIKALKEKHDSAHDAAVKAADATVAAAFTNDPARERTTSTAPAKTAATPDKGK